MWQAPANLLDIASKACKAMDHKTTLGLSCWSFQGDGQQAYAILTPTLQSDGKQTYPTLTQSIG